MELAGGQFLIATVSLLDPNFHRTVVLVCDHLPDEGTFGLVLNRPMPTPEEVTERLPFVDGRLCQGGPVRTDTLQVVHPYGERIPGAIPVMDGVFLGGDFGVLEEGLRSGRFAAERCRFFLGYAGWGKGQLVAECDQDSWLVTPASADLIWQDPEEDLWVEAVRACSSFEPVYRHFPQDAGWN